MKLRKLVNLLTLMVSVFILTSSLSLMYYRQKSRLKPKNFPGKFLVDYSPSNSSYCYFKHGLPKELVYEDDELEGTPQKGFSSNYRVLYNLIEGKYNSNTVTYATHATTEFVRYISELVVLWEGPISLAIFTPGQDAAAIIKQLTYLCYCLPEMSKVSVHFVFPVNQTPVVQVEQQRYMNCTLAAEDQKNATTFRKEQDLIYPVNVCRNVARNAATSHYALVADIQLIPCERLVSKFVNMLVSAGAMYPSNRVFVLPLFEVEEGEDIPKTKEDLMEMLRQERAVYFHRYVCSHCQKFPGIEKWMQTPDTGFIKPFFTVPREYPFHRWEPIYIGTKHDPLYSEELSWEGKQDKMTQMLEMCLIGYRFVILDGAFLVHWPGIKMKSQKKAVSVREIENSRYYGSISANLSKKYPKNLKCKAQ